MGTYRASDPGGGGITWSLTGDDAGDFRISGGVLRFRSTPNFESPQDDGGDNVYKVTVGASDGRTAAFRNVSVTVTNRVPTITSGPTSVSYAEDETGPVGSYSASDPGGGTISWWLPSTTFATDHNAFRISSSGEITFKRAPNYESPHDSDQNNEYNITVRASDGRLSADREITITVTDANERPEVASGISDTMMTVGTSTTIGLQGKFSDPDGDTLTYTALSSNTGVVAATVSASTLTLTASSALVDDHGHSRLVDDHGHSRRQTSRPHRQTGSYRGLHGDGGASATR